MRAFDLLKFAFNDCEMDLGVHVLGKQLFAAFFKVASAQQCGFV